MIKTTEDSSRSGPNSQDAFFTVAPTADIESLYKGKKKEKYPLCLPAHGNDRDNNHVCKWKAQVPSENHLYFKKKIIKHSVRAGNKLKSSQVSAEYIFVIY